jgi:hypothetical protein
MLNTQFFKNYMPNMQAKRALLCKIKCKITVHCPYYMQITHTSYLHDIDNTTKYVTTIFFHTLIYNMHIVMLILHVAFI